MNIKKCIIPAPKRHNFQKLSQIQNRKLYFSPTFQKVELRNSTFFQLLSQKQSALKFKRRHLKQFQLRHQLGLEKFFNLLMNIIKINIGNAKIFVF